MSKSKSPSGLQLVRNGYKFTCGWSVPSGGYGDGQEFEYRIWVNGNKKPTAYKKLKISDSGKKKVIPIKKAVYNPESKTTLNAIQFRVRGNQDPKKDKKKMSNWAQSKKYTISKPVVPTVTATLEDSIDYIMKFEYTVEHFSNSDRWWTVCFESETCLQIGKRYVKGEDIPEEDWTENIIDTIRGPYGEDKKTFTRRIPENSQQMPVNQEDIVTRWFRVRTRGPGGNTGWQYSHHAYGIPQTAQNTKATLTENKQGGYDCVVTWTSVYSLNHPIDKIDIEYAIAPPTSDMKAPDGVAWQPAKTIEPSVELREEGFVDKTKSAQLTLIDRYVESSGYSESVKEGIRKREIEEAQKKPKNLAFEDYTKPDERVPFFIDGRAENGQAVFVRVNFFHDGKPHPGEAVMCTNPDSENTGITTLAKPEGLSVQPGDQGRIGVSAENKATDGSFLVVRIFKGVKDDGNPDYEDIGIITKNDSLPKTIAIPDITNYDIGVYAAVCDEMPEPTVIDNRYNRYNIVAKMISEVEREGGYIAKAPSEIKLEHDGKGTVLVTWDWSWEEANKAEVTWSDHKDAWDSTDEPSSHTLSNLKNGKLYVSNLAIGSTWYFRIRLIKENGNDETPGIWSEIKSVYLSSSPITPVAEVVPSVVNPGQKFTFKWGYVSTDGSPQQTARICQATLKEDGTFEYGEDVSTSITSEQSVEFDPEKLGWETGNKYYLAVKTTSESGKECDDWSVPKSVIYAEPLVVEIEKTSLVEEQEEVNPSVFESDGIISFETDIEEVVTKLEVELDPIQDTSGGAPSPDHICPIGGHNRVSATKTGKNLFDESAEPTMQQVYTQTTETERRGFKFALPMGTYTIKAYSREDSINAFLYGNVVNEDGSRNRFFYVVANSSLYTTTITLTDGQYIVIYDAQAERQTSGTKFAYYDIQLELGSTATDYEPHQGQDTYTQELSETVYGATIDFVNGRLVIDSTIEVFDGNRSTYTSSASGSNWRAMWDVAGMKKVSGTFDDVNARLLADSCPIDSIAATNPSGATSMAISGYPNDQIITCVVPNISSKADFVAYMNAHPVTVFYPLATPRVIELTPQQIETFAGVNHIWTDGDYLRIRTAEGMTDVLALKSLPLTVKAKGVGDGGTIRIEVTRAEDYFLDRPDESMFNGFEGEVVVNHDHSGESEFIFQKDDLYQDFDDEGKYTLIAYGTDTNGQEKASDPIDFKVLWEEQAKKPDAEVRVDQNELVVFIKPTAPDDTPDDATCDIYRLTAERPQLIIRDGKFGETYVDPFPTLGKNGGHRVVYKTKYGDYKYDGEYTWTDFNYEQGDVVYSNENIFDFDSGRATVIYNAEFSRQWTKNFSEVHFLGGSIRGYWNPDVSRKDTISTVIEESDASSISDICKLANYAGPCRVRTIDGINSDANVEVSESFGIHPGLVRNLNINITKVDSSQLDGMTLEEWEEM